MQTLVTPLRTLCVFTVLCILLAACKKVDQPWPGPGHSNCKCDAQSLEGWYPVSDGGNTSPFIRPHKFTKTYDWQGQLHTLYVNTDSPNPVFLSVSTFSKQGNKAFLVDSANLDTVLIVELNNKGLPKKTILKQVLGGPATPPHVKHYHYNHKDQLVAYEDSLRNIYFQLNYDQYGNVSRYIFKNTGQTMVEFTYDYSTPIKGAEYMIDGWIGLFTELEYLHYMGYLDLMPHHTLVRAVNNFRYPFYDRSFTNQVINANGYVTNYTFTLNEPDVFIDTRTVWHCPGDNQHITQKTH